ncbi:MAG: polysaccharide biosynthesis C-terminal domain-containing protein, partial [Dehalococcoidia bacterium]|nr:polysaccharide biosynthesis C-terminal domain-containing protein [Dehalococcoidia bacterium]
LGIVAWGSSLIAMALNKQIDIVFLNIFSRPSSEIGFYNLAYSLSVQLYVLALGLGPLAQATLAEGYAKTGQEGMRRGWALFTKFDGALELPVFIFAIFYGQQLITTLYTGVYAPVFSIFYPFALVRLLILISGSTFCTSIFYIIHKGQISLSLRMAAAVANVVLDVVLIPIWGVMGAVVATSVATLGAYTLEMVFLWRYIRPSFPFVFQGKLLLALLLAIVPTFVLGGEGLFTLLGKAAIYAVTYVTILFLIKPLGEEDKNLLRAIDPRLYAIAKWF